jgi:hypothetical protein
MSANIKQKDPTLTAQQIRATMDSIHQETFDLSTLPISWQREIDYIGSECAGGGEHIIWMMVVLYMPLVQVQQLPPLWRTEILPQPHLILSLPWFKRLAGEDTGRRPYE